MAGSQHRARGLACAASQRRGRRNGTHRQNPSVGCGGGHSGNGCRRRLHPGTGEGPACRKNCDSGLVWRRCRHAQRVRRAVNTLFHQRPFSGWKSIEFDLSVRSTGTTTRAGSRISTNSRLRSDASRACGRSAPLAPGRRATARLPADLRRIRTRWAYWPRRGWGRIHQQFHAGALAPPMNAVWPEPVLEDLGRQAGLPRAGFGRAANRPAAGS